MGVCLHGKLPRKLAWRKSSPSLASVSLLEIIRGSLLIIRVQRVNRKDFHGIVHSTSDSLSSNFKGQVKRERELDACLTY